MAATRLGAQHRARVTVRLRGRTYRSRHVAGGMNCRSVGVSTTMCHELAGLARLSLTDEEAETFATQLDPILAYLRQLQRVDVSGVEETSPIGPDEQLREDAPLPPLTQDAALSQAPAVRGGQVVVPKFKSD